MNVRELIDLLEQFGDDLPVIVTYDHNEDLVVDTVDTTFHEDEMVVMIEVVEDVY